MTEDIIKEDMLKEEADLSAEALAEAETQVYEIGFHIVPSVDEANVGKEVDIIKALIEKNGGIFIAEEFPKLIDLAYTIIKGIEGKKERFDTAYFGWIKFEMKTDNIVNVKEEVDHNKNILRYLIIKTVKESTLIPKSISSVKEDTVRKEKSVPVSKPETPEKVKPTLEEKKTPVSDAELDKTIEELIVE